MTGQFILQCAAPEPGERPRSRQLLLPRGRFEHPEVGTVVVTEADLDAIMAAFAAGELSAGETPQLPVRTGHLKGWQVPAAGWITAFQKSPAGLLAEIEWTKVGLEAVVDRQYPYISPELRWTAKSADGTLHTPRLAGAGLVVAPFFKGLPQLQIAAGDPLEVVGVVCFGEPDMADEDKVAAPAATPAPEPPAAAVVPGGTTAAGGAGGVDLGALQGRVAELEQRNAELERAQRLAAYREELGGVDFGAAEQPLRLAPASRSELAEALADLDPAVGAQVLHAVRRLRLYPTGALGLDAGAAEPAQRALTPEEATVAAQLGLTPEQLLKEV